MPDEIPTTDAPVPENAEPQPPPSGPWQPVFSAFSPIEAHIIGGMLVDSGIECVFSNEFIAAVESPISNLTGGVQVLVRASEVAQANRLLQEMS